MSVVKKDYLLCYDISDAKRLVKVASFLTKVSFRIQYSVFLLQKSTKVELDIIIKALQERIDVEKDDVRIYTIKNSGYRLGKAVDLDEPFILL